MARRVFYPAPAKCRSGGILAARDGSSVAGVPPLHGCVMAGIITNALCAKSLLIPDRRCRPVATDGSVRSFARDGCALDPFLVSGALSAMSVISEKI